MATGDPDHIDQPQFQVEEQRSHMAGSAFELNKARGEPYLIDQS
jgi:hypothetical protein